MKMQVTSPSTVLSETTPDRPSDAKGPIELDSEQLRQVSGGVAPGEPDLRAPPGWDLRVPPILD